MIDETKIIHTQVYDDEHEEWIDKEMTIAEYLDAYTEEGCPQSDTGGKRMKDEEREQRLKQHIENLRVMRETMLDEADWERFKPYIEAVTTGAFAIQKALEEEKQNGGAISRKAVVDWLTKACGVEKAKIVEEDFDTFPNVPPTMPPSGTYECFHCGRRTVIWDSDFDFSDYCLEGEGIVHVCHCTNCGAEIEYKISLHDEEEEEEDGTGDTGEFTGGDV